MNEPSRKIITLDDLERRNINNHFNLYFDWIRQIVSLSVASLTALIALQGSYLPTHPELPILLAVCWAGLLSTILLGVLALRTQYSVYIRSADRIRTMREKHGDAYAAKYLSKIGITASPWYHKWVVRLMVASFVLSLVSLCTFSVINLLFKSA